MFNFIYDTLIHSCIDLFHGRDWSTPPSSSSSSIVAITSTMCNSWFDVLGNIWPPRRWCAPAKYITNDAQVVISIVRRWGLRRVSYYYPPDWLLVVVRCIDTIIIVYIFVATPPHANQKLPHRPTLNWRKKLSNIMTKGITVYFQRILTPKMT